MQHVLLAHGSPDARHGSAVRSLATAVGVRGLPCEAVFLEHDRPLAEDWFAEAQGELRALGLLLSPGFHARVDLPRIFAATPAHVTDRGVLGCGPWLDAALDEAVAAAGGDGSTRVLVAWAGSSRAEARAHVAEYVASWSARRVGVATVTSDLDEVAALVDRDGHAVVLPFLVAPGVFADRIADAAGSAGVPVAPVVGLTDAFVDAVVARLGGVSPAG